MFEEIFFQAAQTVVNLYLAVLGGSAILGYIWTRRRH
jgi:hypothetical protein